MCHKIIWLKWLALYKKGFLTHPLLYSSLCFMTFGLLNDNLLTAKPVVSSKTDNKKTAYVVFQCSKYWEFLCGSSVCNNYSGTCSIPCNISHFA